MIYLAYTVHVVVCLFLILVVLLQQGKGADLSVFGGGSTQTAFGARGAATLLHKMTVAGFIAFIVTTTAIGFLQGRGTRGSVMNTVVEETAPAAEAATGEAPAETATPAAQETGAQQPAVPEPEAPTPTEVEEGGDSPPAPAEDEAPGAGQ